MTFRYGCLVCGYKDPVVYRTWEEFLRHPYHGCLLEDEERETDEDVDR